MFQKLLEPFKMSCSRPHHDTRATPAANKKRDASPHGKEGSKHHPQAEDDEADDAVQDEKNVKLRAQPEDTEDDEAEGAPVKQKRDKHRAQADNNPPQAAPLKWNRVRVAARPDASPRKGERIRKATKQADGMVNFEHPNKKKPTILVDNAAQPTLPSNADENTAPPQPHPQPTTAVKKTTAKNKSPTPEVKFPGLTKYAARKEAQAQKEEQTPEEIEAEVTKRTARMADRIASLLKKNQELWLESQAVAEEFLGYAAYVGDEDDEREARARFDGVRKRKIEGERYEWPVAKRVREGGAED
ncbi:hypothetical protein P171DRAFT_494332 [Karstenula rhodostoma CBS 690.94]|uniref:Uncharacterized protein n=1 Tax=Karstenula rhodostoma CBS 690.94 TaxID=1392251 RepID=A0A9P4UBD5_9PLEO|nr:hypothetical protein P171DRAFT_494332 [Karstenula rhodostoma CBS 690.94]